MGPCQLTLRQRERLELREKHFSAKEIGRELGISPHTVAMHFRLAEMRLQERQTCAPRPLRDSDASSSAEDITPLFERVTMGVSLFGALLSLLGLVALATALLIHIGSQALDRLDSIGARLEQVRDISAHRKIAPHEAAEPVAASMIESGNETEDVSHNPNRATQTWSSVA
jgi:hypothetical protein